MKHYKVLFRFTLNVSWLSAAPASQTWVHLCLKTSAVKPKTGPTAIVLQPRGFKSWKWKHRDVGQQPRRRQYHQLPLFQKKTKNDWNNSIIHGNRTDGGQNIAYISPNFSQRVCFLRLTSTRPAIWCVMIRHMRSSPLDWGVLCFGLRGQPDEDNPSPPRGKWTHIRRFVI